MERIRFGRGRRGSVALQLSAATPVGLTLVHEEVDLYEPLKRLRDDRRAGAKACEDFLELRTTASPRGRTRDSGQWSRPDLTLVEVNTFEHRPGSNLAVTTFEVNRLAEVPNIASLDEAAADSRWVHYAYLAAEIPNEGYEFPDRFVAEVQRFRVG